MTIPGDLNVELLLSYLPEENFKVALKGLHKRNAYNDIVEIDEKPDGTLLIGIGRNSLYNSLPEYMFHPIDRFSNLPRLEEKERFAEELEKQEREMERAYRFFAPVDVKLLLLRMQVRESLRPVTEVNKVLIDILGDRLTESQLRNRFIKQAVAFLPCSKMIRGNKSMLAILLRKVFMEEELNIEVCVRETAYSDAAPRYADGLDAALGDSYVGNAYDEAVTVINLHYWPEEACDEHFLSFVADMELFRLFLQDWFMSVEEELHFDITNDSPALRLSDDIVYNYLDYNTNI